MQIRIENGAKHLPSQSKGYNGSGQFSFAQRTSTSSIPTRNSTVAPVHIQILHYGGKDDAGCSRAKGFT
jgi:hypothetical protein